METMSRAEKTTDHLLNELETLRARVAELERVKTALDNSEKRFRILFEFAPDGYYLNDSKGVFVDGNKQAEEITGYQRHELIGKSFFKLKLLPARYIPRAARLLAKNALGKPTGPDEFVLNRKDGGRITVEIRTFPVKMNGQSLILGIARDITVRKESESKLLRTTSEIIVEERLSTIGEMTAGITHELAQPLNASKIIAQTLLRSIGAGHYNEEELREDLTEIVQHINKMAEIIHHVKTFTRHVEGRSWKSTNVNDIIVSALRLVGQQLEDHNVEMLQDLDSSIPKVHGDPVRLEQVFLNLINNAQHAVDEKEDTSSEIEIRTNVADDGNNVVIEFSDNGIGIAEDDKDKVFERFYSTKQPGIGTGLGLSISRGIIKEHNGRIEVESALGQGSTFRVFLPVAPAHSE